MTGTISTMDVQPRPPLYLTDTDFDRLRLTDDQWSKMELQALERLAARKAQDEAQRRRSEEVERFVRPPLIVFLSLFVAGAFYLAVEVVTGAKLYDLIGQPIFIIIWTAVVAWMMRKS